MEDLGQYAIQILQEYGYVIVFLGTVIGGEIVILAAAFLASLGLFNITWVIVLSFFGIVLSDSIWYSLGYSLHSFAKKYKKFFPLSDDKMDTIRKQFNDHYGKFLVVSKFIYGIRILALMFSGYQKVSYKKFLRFNLIGTTIWLIILVLIGYTMGFSWGYLEQYSQLAKYWALAGILVVFLLRYVFNRIMKWL